MPIPPHVEERTPLRVDRTYARDGVAERFPDVTDAEIDAALTSIDQDALYDTERARWTVEVWDRTSPINGVAAEHFLNRADVPDDGDVYLVKADGRVVIFQPHEPHVAGIVPVPAGEGAQRGGVHADEIAGTRTTAEVMRRVAEHVEASRSRS